MSHAAYTANTDSTLGFFVHGIPCVFLRTDLAFRTNSEFREYLQFANRYYAKTATPSEFRSMRIACGFEGFIVLQHEMRHFHDALLSPAYFETFVAAASMNLYLLQLVGHIAPINESKLPVNIEQLEAGASKKAKEILKAMRHARIKYSASVSALMKPVQWRGKDLDATYLLETHAVVTELVALVVQHEWDAAEYYYSQRIRPLTDEYNWLINELSKEFGFAKTIAVLIYLLPYCLYTSSSPTQRLVDILSGSSTDVNLKEVMRSHQRTLDHFRRGDPLARRAAGLEAILVDIGIDTAPLDGDDQKLIRDVAALPTAMYALRSSLIKTYVHGFKLDARMYVEQTNNLPIPPAVFFTPDEMIAVGGVMGVPSEILAEKVPTRVILCAQGESKTDAGSAVLSALIPIPGFPKPCLDLQLVAMLMASVYFEAALFSKKHPFYGECLDPIYYDLFTKRFCRPSI